MARSRAAATAAAAAAASGTVTPVRYSNVARNVARCSRGSISVSTPDDDDALSSISLASSVATRVDASASASKPTTAKDRSTSARLASHRSPSAVKIPPPANGSNARYSGAFTGCATCRAARARDAPPTCANGHVPDDGAERARRMRTRGGSASSAPPPPFVVAPSPSPSPSPTPTRAGFAILRETRSNRLRLLVAYTRNIRFGRHGTIGTRPRRARRARARSTTSATTHRIA